MGVRTKNIKQILNIAGYRFFSLKQAAAIRLSLRDFCRDLGLKGSVLLSEEGVNLYLAGKLETIEQFKNHFHDKLKIPSIEYKQSWSAEQPYSRMLVKVKKEIISTGFEYIKPSEFTAPSLAPKELKKWLDEDRDFTLLDTRNDFEIDLGKFERAVDINIKSFREFLKQAAKLPEETKKKPLVMYCTGGIRCEKASALFLKDYGFSQVYQLEGGILKYFEQVGHDHYQGECFVFDKRIGLNAHLAETESTQCYACRRPLTKEDQKSPLYKAPDACPYCHE